MNLFFVFISKGWMHGLAVIHQRRHCLFMRMVRQCDAFVTYQFSFAVTAWGYDDNHNADLFQGLHARLPQSRFISTWSTGLFIGGLLFRVWTHAVWFERLCSIMRFRRGLHEIEVKLSI